MTESTPEFPGLLLPEGTRLVHIGPHKTGTTSLQAALFAARPAMETQGVRQVGTSRNPASAVRAVTGQPAPTSLDTPPSIRWWTDLVGEFRRAKEARVVVSSEFFSWARPDVVQRIADDLGRERVHIVVTLRPLGRIIPSQWQQNVQAGTLLPFEDWLHEVLDDEMGGAASPFWKLHRHDQLIARWASVFGTDHVTAVVVDETDHGMLLRVFETMLGLRSGTLVPDKDLANRSLTLSEVEAVRAFNLLAKQVGITRADHAKTMRFGSAMHMKMREPGPGEQRIDAPQWALDRARARAQAIVPAIEASGVRIVGDILALTAPLTSRLPNGIYPTAVAVSPVIAGEMALGVLLACGAAHSKGDGSSSAGLEPIEVARVSTRQLIAVTARRLRGAAVRRVRGRRGGG